MLAHSQSLLEVENPCAVDRFRWVENAFYCRSQLQVHVSQDLSRTELTRLGWRFSLLRLCDLLRLRDLLGRLCGRCALLLWGTDWVILLYRDRLRLLLGEGRSME